MKRSCSILLFIVLLIGGFLVWRGFFSWPIRTRAAVERGDLRALERLVDDPNTYLAATKINRASLLHLATRECQTNVVEWLLKQGADPNSKDSQGRTVLMYTISYLWRTNACRDHLMQTLLKVGADPDAGEGKVKSPVFLATMLGDEKALKLLLPYAKRPNDTDYSGCTALHYADKPEVFRLLVDAGWDPNVKNKHGETAAEMIAARAKQRAQ